MKYNNGLVISTMALTLIMTGCVKKADTIATPAVYDNPQPVYETATQPVYETTTQPVYETATPIVYEETISSGTTYSETPIDNTLITTDGAYNQVVNAGTSYGQPATTVVNTGNSAYSNPYGSSSETYPDPYGNGAIVSDYPTPSSSSNSYTSSPAPSGGIHLQIAALKNYYAAEEFKKSLSLDPKYSAYVKRGSINKVIVTGMTSISEVNRLKENRFPGSFIVSGGSSYSSSSTPSSSSSSSSYSGGYTENNPYGSPSSYGSSSSSSSNSGVGVQIGAFSSRSKAQSVANANGGQYQAVVSQGTSQGRTIYRVVLTGFSSRDAAKRALASGQIKNGFVTSNY
jgi:cell division septation protein DedD